MWTKQRKKFLLSEDRYISGISCDPQDTYSLIDSFMNGVFVGSGGECVNLMEHNFWLREPISIPSKNCSSMTIKSVK